MTKIMRILINFIGVIFLFVSISGCNNTGELGVQEDPNIFVVKNSTIAEYPPTLTIGQALDNWKGCSGAQWEKKIGERGENQVVFKCNVDNIKASTAPLGFGYGRSYEEEYNKESAEAFKYIDNVKLAILFTLSANGNTFLTDSGAYIFNFKDGKSYIEEQNLKNKYVGDSSNPLNLLSRGLLDSVYNNIPPIGLVSRQSYQNRQ